MKMDQLKSLACFPNNQEDNLLTLKDDVRIFFIKIFWN